MPSGLSKKKSEDVRKPSGDAQKASGGAEKSSGDAKKKAPRVMIEDEGNRGLRDYRIPVRKGYYELMVDVSIE